VLEDVARRIRAAPSGSPSAHKLGVPLFEAIDLLAELGVRSPLEYDDYLKGLSTATAFAEASKA